MAWNTATDRILVYELTVQGDYDANMRRIVVSDHEFYIVCLLQARSLTGSLEVLHAGYAASDPPGSPPHTLVMIRPDGIEQRMTMEERTDGSDGYVQYQISATDLQNLPGKWRLRVETSWGSAVTSTNHGILDVLEHGQEVTSELPNTTDPNFFTSQASRGAGSLSGHLALVDGVDPPEARVGYGYLYVDKADGNAKLRFGDGTTQTVATD